MNSIKKRFARNIRKNLRAAQKKNTLFLEGHIKNNNKMRQALILESKELDEHIVENQENIFIPVINESTGEKRYEAKNFNDFLNELSNDKTKDPLERYDEVYNILDESFKYEEQFYLEENDSIEEVDVKDLYQKGKEKVKGAIGAGVKAFKHSKIIFFLKIVDKALKLALTVSRSVYALIGKLLFKLVSNLVSAWAAAKLKTSEIWKQIKNWGMTKLESVLEKIMKPFLWVAKKMTNDVEKAKELDPILLSITATSLMLALVYASGGLDVFSSFSNSVEEGMQAALENAPEATAAAMCMSETKSKNTKLLITEECGRIGQFAQDTNNSVLARVMTNLGNKINASLDQAEGVIIQNIEGTMDGQDFSEETVTISKKLVDRQTEALETIKLNILKGTETGFSMDYVTDDVKKVIQNEIAAVGQIAGNQMSDQSLQAYAETFKISHTVDSISSMSEETGKGIGTSVYQKIAKITVSGVKGAGVKESKTLTENQILRFKKLSGVV